MAAPADPADSSGAAASVSAASPANTVLTLGPPRHACHACGNCCTGWKGRLADDSERERVIRQAAELGVPDPIVAGELRQVDSVCVFLGADKLCRIHARYGEDEKPITCQLFPRRSVRAEDGIRFGVDPGCSSSWRSFATGPDLSLWFIPTGRDQHKKPGLAAVERKLVSLARSPGMTLARFASVLANDPIAAPDQFPKGMGTRLIDRLRAVIPLLEDRENGPLIGADLAATRTFLRRLGTARPLPSKRLPPLVVPPGLDAIVLDALQRTLYLRIGSDEIPPSGHALVVIGGALACLLADPRSDRFGPAFAAWSRVSRLDGFWEAFAPDTDAARWVLTGE